MRVIIGSGIAFAIHLAVLQYLQRPMFDHMIVWSYILNTLLATGILVALLKAPPSLQGSLGFLFLGGSFLKFALFFIVFYPVYHADGSIDPYEFSTFFIPYAVCLTFETQTLISKLSRE